MGWYGTSQAIPSHPDGSFGPLDERDSWDLGGMMWDIPGNPIPLCHLDGRDSLDLCRHAMHSSGRMGYPILS